MLGLQILKSAWMLSGKRPHFLGTRVETCKLHREGNSPRRKAVLYHCLVPDRQSKLRGGKVGENANLALKAAGRKFHSEFGLVWDYTGNIHYAGELGRGGERGAETREYSFPPASGKNVFAIEIPFNK